MVKIVANVNKQDVTVSWSLGQTFPHVEGKLISVEVGGMELVQLIAARGIPLNHTDSVITWHGRMAGRTLRDLRELAAR